MLPQSYTISELE